MQCPLCGKQDTVTVIRLEAYPAYIKPVPDRLMNEVPLKDLIIDLCETCGLIFQQYPPDKELLDKIYKINYAAYQSPFESGIGSGRTKEYFSFIERSVDFRSIKDALEIGCFDGYLLSIIKDKFAVDVIGCDPSAGAEIAGRSNIKVVKDYFSPALFDNSKFGLVILRGLLEHVVGAKIFIGEVKKILKPGGYIAIEVPDVIYTLENVVVGDFFHEHVSYFSELTVNQLFASVGFKPVTLETSGGYIKAVFKNALTESQVSDVQTVAEKEVGNLNTLFERYNKNISRFGDEIIAIKGGWEESGSDVFIYGAGGHTVGYLYRVSDLINIKGVFDGDVAKIGKYLPKYNLRVYPKEHIAKISPKVVVIVSSKVYQDEIIDYLKPYMSNELKIIKLYPRTEVLGLTGAGYDNCR